MFKPAPAIPADIQMPAADPQQVASWLAQHPRKLMLTSTTDGMEYEFQNDGGKVSGAFNEAAGQMVYRCAPNGRAQQCEAAARRMRQDKGFSDRPSFVSARPIEPAFAGDRLHTGPGGVIKLMDAEDEKTIAESKTVADRRRVRIRAEAQAAAREYAKITNPNAPTDGPDIAALIADAEQRAVDRAAEREAALLAQIEELKAANAPEPEKQPTAAEKRAAKKAAKEAEKAAAAAGEQKEG